MKVTISFKHIKHSTAVDERLNLLSSRLEKYLGDKVDVRWMCSRHEGHHHTDVQLTGPTFHYAASADDRNLYRTLDLAFSKVEKQISKKKSKWKNKLHKGKGKGKERRIFLEPESAWALYDEESYGDVA